MTRKDYILIAAAIRELLADIERDSASEYLTTNARAILSGEQSGVRAAALRLSDRLEYDNPRFERETFLKACSLTA